MLVTACDDMLSHLYDVEHGSLIDAFSGELAAFRKLLLCSARIPLQWRRSSDPDERLASQFML